MKQYEFELSEEFVKMLHASLNEEIQFIGW